VKNKSSFTIVKIMLISLRFELGEVLKYYPHHVISNLRIAIKYSLYVHHTNLEMERLANKKIGAKLRKFCGAIKYNWRMH
jgi:hypothetical protein